MVSPGPRSYGHRPDLPGLAPHAEALPLPLKHGRPVAPRPASPWVPWPTATGFWWARARPGAALCVVEARVEPGSSWIYFTGVECSLYANERREPWEFCPVEPPR